MKSLYTFLILFAINFTEIHIITILVLESSPSLRDLTDLVTPNYAAKWRVIASLLGLSKPDIDIIAHDHGRSAINCCGEMWGKWLNTYTEATWGDVLKIIDHKTVTEEEKGNYMMVILQ